MRNTSQPTTLNEWRDAIHQNAVEHGWWEEERSFGDIVALCHSELSEALEEYRNDRKYLYYNCTENPGNINPCEYGEDEETECRNSIFADIYSNCDCKNNKPEGIAVELIDCMIRILDWCGKEGIDVEEIMHLKHEYNQSRPYRHGGKKL